MRSTLNLVLLAASAAGACASQRGAASLGAAAADPAPVPDLIPMTGSHPVLPAPDTTRSVTHFAKLVPWPEGRTPKAPPGFSVSLYADGLLRPRWLYVLPNGDVLVAESASAPRDRDTLLSREELAARWASGNRGHSANRITLLRDADRDGKPELRSVLLSGLNRPVGMVYLNGWLYVANTDELVRYPFQPGDTTVIMPPKRVLGLPGGGYNNHWTRNVVANPAGTKLYVTVGSATNVDTEGIDAEDPRRAAILELNPDGSGMRVFAGGLRNPGGMDWTPGTATLWTVVNERDGLGDDLVPDYLTSVREGGFYGWPYSYFGRHVDPRQQGKRPDLVASAIAPDYALGAHTASLGLVFYRGNAFPSHYRSGAYIGQHGSWNRSRLNGYRVMFVPFTDGRPSGPAEEFLGGFIANSERSEVYGRPIGVALLPDGSLLLADDPANRIWRVAYPQSGRGETPVEQGRATQADTAVRLATVTQGLARPEGMRWDPEQRIWFVSNINGGPEHDNNGFITQLRADGTIEALRFVAGGSNGVTLHAPKGMAIVGDTLWVADLDAVRGFDRDNGRPVASVDLHHLGALFLNDITVRPDGALYVTDTGVRFDSAGNRTHPGPDRIFRILGRSPSVAYEGPALAQPNGITYDRAGRRFLLAPVAGDSAVQQWTGAGSAPEDLARGPGRYDGIELLGHRILVSAWYDSTVSEVAGDRLRPVIRGVPTAADIGVDPAGAIVGVPMVGEDRVELWRLPEK